MEQTPIEKAIAELEESYPIMGVNYVIEKLKEIIPYEKKRDRNIAEKAWDACWECKNKCDLDNNEDKQTYLNQNHPL